MRSAVLKVSGYARIRRIGWIIGGLIGVGVLWAGGLLLFAAAMPAAPAGNAGKTDAIVVLTGGSGRLEEGLALLDRQQADKLYISGVNRQINQAALLRRIRREADGLGCCIRVGYAVDTAENAHETAAWMVEQGYRSLRLVTASYHMRRSLLEFQRAMPDVEVIAHPTFPSEFHQENWWAWKISARLMVREYHKFLVAVLRHWVGDAGRYLGI